VSSASNPNDVAPPITSIGVVGWLRRNLFSNWYNTALTLAFGWLLATTGADMVRWMLFGARWEVVTANLRLFMVGPYPPDQVWRVWAVLCLMSAVFGLAGGAYGGTLRVFAISLVATYAGLALLPFGGEVQPWLAENLSVVVVQGRLWLAANLALTLAFYYLARGRRSLRGAAAYLSLASFVVAIVALGGVEGVTWLPSVSTSQWGGLLLTFVLTTVSIVLSFPLGVLLALGRRSQYPAMRWFSIGYIELVRGVPLITILYMTQIMLPLFLPGEVRIDNLVRAMAGMTLFTAAYMAENVRGGLQAIPTGQVEAAEALGLNSGMTTLLIVLPQALRLVIPATVGQFIALFKDTTLVLIVGLLDLLSIGRSVLAQAEFMGLQTEVYLFVAAVFFVFSYAMSYASYRIEAALGVGKR
jgi:general L-amino acid transport system permease protein